MSKYVVKSASGVIKSGFGNLKGLFCSSSSSLVVKLTDSTDGTGSDIISQVTLTAGQHYTFSISEGLSFVNGLYFTVVSGTGSVSIEYD